MEETRQAPTPEERHRAISETRKELAAEANAALHEASEEIATEASVRAGVQVEEAERWDGVNTDDEAIQNVLTRSVVQIIVRDELEKKLKSGRKLRVKLGIDPTGPQIHLGRSVTLHKMRQFQDLGHQVVLIIGDFTGLVGDASDKDAARPMLSREQIESNMATYIDQMGKILDLAKVEFRYNSQWLAPLNFNDVIKLAAQFTVAQMIQRENFSDRWEQGKPIGLQELLYPLMQGFDSVAIEADLELGGTDQLFNLLAGRALQEDFGQQPQSVLCTMMIEGTDGRKMSTTWGNSIYINDPPRDQFGKIMSMRDDIIPIYFEAATQVPMDEVRSLKEGLVNGTLHPMDAKKRLAWEIVRMYHGQAAADQARTDFELQFQQKALPTQVPLVPLERGRGDKANAQGEVGILDLLINTGLAPNRKQAQRLVEQGGVRVDDERVTTRDHLVKPAQGMVLKAGRNFVKLED